ncbi:betaine--homocysteine S-methyltransferase 1-like [Diadema antillarum]|uniref:betaine--homocysteine S-methyltransferase 1-like n=2 Tax=Diadema antillarum TaxID=105358 RepID=UPI003A86E0DF
MSTKKGLLERLAAGPVIGDGSMLMTMEKRGYAVAGAWTPEAVIQHPDAVKQLHREFLRAGADVLQTFTFYASEDSIEGKNSSASVEDTLLNWEELNERACDLAREVADEGDALVAGSMGPVVAYEVGKGKDVVQNQFRQQCDVFSRKKVDFLVGEFFSYTEEAEWAIEVMKTYGLPVVCMMRICIAGDEMGVKPADSAVRLAKAGADVIGVNCCYDPNIALETIAMMKEGLQASKQRAHLILQPVGFHTQEIAGEPIGYTELPEFPYAMEPRVLTRIDAHKFARAAYELGVRYVGGCCGFEPHHIRAISDELKEERGRGVFGIDKSGFPQSLNRSFVATLRKRASRDYWMNLKPSAGRDWIMKRAELRPKSSDSKSS